MRFKTHANSLEITLLDIDLKIFFRHPNQNHAIAFTAHRSRALTQNRTRLGNGGHECFSFKCAAQSVISAQFALYANWRTEISTNNKQDA